MGIRKGKTRVLHVNDLAAGAIYIMTISAKELRSTSEDEPNHINIGTGQDLTILDLAKKIADIIGFKGEIKTKELPDGTLENC